jgi:hypothetical protein
LSTSVQLVVPSDDVHAEISQLSPASYETIFEDIARKGFHCDAAMAVVKAQVPLHDYDQSIWSSGCWTEIDIVKQGRTIFEKLSWFTERIHMPTWLSEWNIIEDKLSGTPCHRVS